MAPRPRITASRRFGPVRASVALTWAGTQWTNPVLLNGDVAFQDISSNLTARLARELTNAVLLTVRGNVKVATGALVSNTFTRMIMSMGIVWADKDFVDPANAGAGSGAVFPNPLTESMKWIWRMNYAVAGASLGVTLGAMEKSSSLGNFDVHVLVKRKQPSLQHRLYFLWAKTLPVDGFDANLVATPAQLTGAVNVLMKTP